MILRNPPEAFEQWQGIPVILSPPQGGFRYGDSSTGPTIRYTIQGCYNVVVASPQQWLVARQLYENDCTKLIIDSIDVRKSLELQRGNIDIKNLVIDQNNIVIKIAMVALVATTLFFCNRYDCQLAFFEKQCTASATAITKMM